MVDPDVIEHESRHAAAAVICGLEVSRIDAVGDGRTYRGQLKYYRADDDQRRSEIKTLLVGGDIPNGYPPNGAVADNHDLVHLRRLIDGLRLDAAAYYRLKVEADTMMDSAEFRSLKARFVQALEGNDGRLDEQDVDDVVDRWRWDMAGA
jgi:hypothetical protein